MYGPEGREILRSCSKSRVETVGLWKSRRKKKNDGIWIVSKVPRAVKKKRKKERKNHFVERNREDSGLLNREVRNLAYVENENKKKSKEER